MSSSSGPDLFVVCKQCHSEVSPYITECPYCGARLRKRAPKLDREGRIAERRPRRARRTAPRPSLGRLRRGEIPGIRAEVGRPWVSMAVVLVSLAALLVERFKPDWIAHLVVFEPLHAEHWRILTSSFAYDNTGYAFIALSAIALFGWLIERRHGHVVAGLLMIVGGAAGMALAGQYGSSVDPLSIAIGGNAVALALIVAWAVPDVLARRRGEEVEGDLLGALVFAVVVAVVPAFVDEASWLAAAGGAVAGLVCGLLLAALASSRS